MSSGADKIVSNIMSEAQAKVDANIGEAQAKVEAILADGEKRAEASKVKISDDAAKQADMRYQQIISEAKMNARRAELGAKEDVIEEAFNKATEDLTNMANTNDPEYVDALIEMIKEAAVEIGGGDLIVFLKEEDISKVVSTSVSLETSVAIELRSEGLSRLIKDLIKPTMVSNLS